MKEEQFSYKETKEQLKILIGLSGGRAERSEILQTRFTPYLRFATQILGQKEGRTLSSMIEYAVEQYVKTQTIDMVSPNRVRLEIWSGTSYQYEPIDIHTALHTLWQPTEALQIVAKGLYAPYLLQGKQKKVWSMIRKCCYFWKHYQIAVEDETGCIVDYEWQPIYSLSGVIISHVETLLDMLNENQPVSLDDIPDEISEKVERPDEYPKSKTMMKSIGEKRDAIALWSEHVYTLLRHEYVEEDTPEGKKMVQKLVYPSAQEQEAMVAELLGKKAGRKEEEDCEEEDWDAG